MTFGELGSTSHAGLSDYHIRPPSESELDNLDYKDHQRLAGCELARAAIKVKIFRVVLITRCTIC